MRRRRRYKSVEEIVERWRSGWLFHWFYRKVTKPPIPPKYEKFVKEEEGQAELKG